MKYVKTKYTIYPSSLIGFEDINIESKVYGIFKLDCKVIYTKDVINESENLKELFDRYVVVNKANKRKFVYTRKEFKKRVARIDTLVYLHNTYADKLKELLYHNEVYGAIWSVGNHNELILKTVAKMVDEGDFELNL